ncbi:FKBP-type peptidyl-prolyl cis-trans isomerase [Paucibacter soli]|uniref:FKBP-type peptidyl-prolyl cis-trans isomerase n=1 Tax=Paucibacter soli TaxID=3133433 RepID=UPI0030A43207
MMKPLSFQRRSALALMITGLLTACGGGGGSSSPADTSGSAAVTVLKTTDTVVGTGATAAAGKTLTVHYTGWLYDEKAASQKGTKFDSSVDRGTPFSFVLGAGQVITGWDQGFVGMKVGGKRTLLIPSSMAYGSAGRLPTIPANAALVFDVELLAVN